MSSEGRSRHFIPDVPADSLPWLTVDEMREVDRLMIEELRITLARMMENAGRNLAALARHLLGGDAENRRVVVLAGPGGNGGGGLVAARHLVSAGAVVQVRLGARPQRLATVPAEQLAILRRMAVPISVGASDGLDRGDLVVDALLGYSGRGRPRGETAQLIELSRGARVIALDSPSGLELETGTLYEPFVRAEATMALAAPKEGLGSSHVAAAVGDLYVADISVPTSVYERLGRAYRAPFGRNTIVRVRRPLEWRAR